MKFSKNKWIIIFFCGVGDNVFQLSDIHVDLHQNQAPADLGHPPKDCI